MDALRLIKSTRHGLTEARSVAQVLAEAWQACALVEAVAMVVALELTELAVEDGSGCGAAEIARAVAERRPATPPPAWADRRTTGRGPAGRSG